MLLRVLLFGWEIGSAGAMVPVAEHARDAGCQLLNASLEPARSLLNKRIGGLVSVNSMDVGDIRADVILAGLGHPRHTAGWTAWRGLRAAFPAFVLLDHWKGIERFMSAPGELDHDTLPDMIGVIDVATQAQLSAAGVPSSRLAVVGNMACREMRRHVSADIGRSMRTRIGLASGQRTHFLASETLHGHGFHRTCDDACHPLERHATRSGTTLLEWAQAQARLDNALLLIRPHPNQNATPDGGADARVVGWDTADDNEILSIADRIYGLSTMMMAKAVAAGIDAVNVADQLAGWAPEQVFMSPVLWETVLASGQMGHAIGNRPGIVDDNSDPQRVLAMLTELGNRRDRVV